MKTLYLDCGMGAAGDMLAAALYELLEDKEAFLQELTRAGIPDVSFRMEASVKCGIKGTHMTVLAAGAEESGELFLQHHHTHDHGSDHVHAHDSDHVHEHHHSSLTDVRGIIEALQIPSEVKEHAAAVYQLIAEAEAHAHDMPVEQIHFHEVGTMDAIADVTAVCLLLFRLHPDRILASPVHVGFGHVHCAHGILPVPAPATAYLLQGIPIYGGSVEGELCTPTGAALLKHFVSSFGSMPAMTIEHIGYGMGKKDFAYANCVRAMMGETAEAGDSIVELTCNLDDMTAERIGFAMEELFRAGALEVYTVPVGMKKSRPGELLCVMCREENRDDMVHLLFKHTTTLGIRENRSRRYTLERSFQTIRTSLGEVRVKSSAGYQVVRTKYEYEDLARIARDTGKSLEEVTEQIRKEIGDR